MGATLDYSMRLILGAPMAGVAMRMFVAVVSALFAAAALAMLAARSALQVAGRAVFSSDSGDSR